jgi:DNA-binding NarL/FixJ family response regulator
MSTVAPAKILMVDDEPNVLSGYLRTIGRTFSIISAEGGAAGLVALESKGPFAVVVTDMRMPQMNGIEFITAARVKSKETVFIMLTGNGDQQTAVDAINHGHIFRFLNKPCPQEKLDAALRAALRQYDLVTAERVLLRETLTGSVKLLVDALELTHPPLAVLQSMVKQAHNEICPAIGLPRDWQMTVAGSLCLIGLVTLPGIKPDEAVPEEAMEAAASLGSRLIGNLPRLGSVAAMILHQRDAGMLPDEISSTSPKSIEEAGAQVLRFCVDLAQEQRSSGSRAVALRNLDATKRYDPRLVAVIRSSINESERAAVTAVLDLPIEQITPGMELANDVKRNDGTLLLSSGQLLTELSVAKLRNFARQEVIPGVVRIRGAHAARGAA